MRDRLLDMVVLGLERPLVVTAMVLGSLLLVSLTRANDRLHRMLDDVLGADRG